MIVVVGLSHQTAPLEVREALAFPEERMAEALERLRDDGIAVVFISQHQSHLLGIIGNVVGQAYIRDLQSRDPEALRS